MDSNFGSLLRDIQDQPGNSSFLFQEKPAATSKTTTAIDVSAIDGIAQREGLSPVQRQVMGALLGQESNNGKNAVTSIDGARGAGQVMPGTFKQYARPGETIDNPDHNLAVMARIVKDLGTKSGDDPARMATGYFSGAGNMTVGKGRAWRNDAADGNGKRVSSYVNDILGRLSGSTAAQAAEPAKAVAVADPSKAPMWTEVEAKPEFQRLSDEDKAYTKKAYFDHWVAPHVGGERDALFEQFMAPSKKKEPPQAGALRTAGDIGIKLAQGVVDLGQSVVGLGSLATGGAVGKGMRAIGYDPEATNAALGEYLSDAQKASDAKTQNAEGFVDTILAAVQNPRAIAGGVAKSLPGMIGGTAVTMGVAKAIGAKAALAAAEPLGGLATEAGKQAGSVAAKKAIEQATGKLMWTGSGAEGAQTAGQIADQAQQAGRGYSDYALPAVAAGTGTALIGRGAGKLMGDAETAIAARLAGGSGAGGITGNLPARIAKSAFSEGVLEEMPQSAQEQVFTNLAMGDPAGKGVGNAAAMGLVTGAAMGAGLGGGQHESHAPQLGERAESTFADDPVEAQQIAPTPDIAPAAEQVEAASVEAPTQTEALIVSPAPVAQAESDAIDAAHLLDDEATMPPALATEAPIVPPRTEKESIQSRKQAANALAQNQQAVPASATHADLTGQHAQAIANYKDAAISGDEVAAQAAEHNLTAVRQELNAAHGAAAKEVADQLAAAQAKIEAKPKTEKEAKARREAAKTIQTESAPVIDTPTALDVAAHEAATSPLNDAAQPTDKQKEAGNYKVGKINLHGLDISIENPAGSTRSGTGKDGLVWETEMRHHYGYIKGTVGMDKDHIDTFIGTNHDSDKVFVVDQVDPVTGKPDEHKVMLGFDGKEQAQAAYQANYDKGWTGGKAITETSMQGFKDWLKSGNTKKPFAKPTTERQAKAQYPAPKLTGKARQKEHARQMADYFTPGNVVKGYYGHDRVISYTPSNGQGEGFSVTVEHVKQEDGQWVPTGEGPRMHRTIPGERELRAGPVERAAPAADPEQPVAVPKTEKQAEQPTKLQGETAAEGRAQVVAQEKQRADTQANERKLAEAERQAGIQKEIASRQDASSDNFQLGQSADDSLAGQGDIFSQPATNTPKALDSDGVNATQKSKPKTEGEAKASRVDAARKGISVGRTPTSAEPVMVKDGVVHIGKYPAQNFETGEDVTVAPDATPTQIRDALVAAGAIGAKNKVFGLNSPLADAAYFRETLPETPSVPERVGQQSSPKLNEHELAKSRKAVAKLNVALEKSGVEPVQALKTAPTAEHALAKRIGKAFGIDVHFVTGNTTFEGVSYKGTAYISSSLRSPALAIAGHETLHAMEQSDPAMGERLRQQINQYLLKDTVANRSDWEQARSGGQDVSVRTAESEVLADINGAMWMDPQFWGDLAKADANLFRQVAYRFMQVATRIVDSLAGTNFDLHALVSDVAAVRAIMVQTWAEHVQNRGGQANEEEAQFSRADGTLDDDILRSIASIGDAFQFKASPSTTVEGITHDIRPDIKVRKITNIPGETRYQFDLPDDTMARMMVRPFNKYGSSLYGFNLNDGEMVNRESDRPGKNAEEAHGKDDVWIDVSLLSEGGSFGAALYNIAANYAHNTGKVFIGDPAGITDEALRRRPEQMLSSALKFGTTEHLAPHPHQVSGKRSAGIAPLDWVYGDHLGNIQKLIDVNLQNLDNQGGNGGIQYDASTGRFTGADGTRLTRKDIRGLAKAGLGRAGNAGGDTLARHALLKSLLQPLRAGQSGRQPLGVLAHLSRQLRNHVSTVDQGSGELKGILYSRTGDLTADGALGDRSAPIITPKQQSLPLEGAKAGSRASWDAPENTRLDNIIYKLQDKHIDLRRAVQAITKESGQIADSYDPYLQEELFHSRSSSRVEAFVNKELTPLLKNAVARQLSLDEIDQYLHARHAKEANALIAERNPEIPDGGSGMTNKDADAYFAGLTDSKRRHLTAVAEKVDAILAETRRLYASYGLESAGTVKEWGDMFKHYVPLMREDDGAGMGIGQGFSIKGKEVKHRTGSTRSVVNILANIALQREKVIVRGEKNRVAVALAGLVKLNPSPDFWTFAPVPERRYNEATGLVEMSINGNWKSADNVVVAKIKDSKGEIQERAIVFNERNERALRMAKSMKNLDTAQLNGLLGVSAKITRYFAAINTQYNPVFGATNLVRDIGESTLNLSSTPLAGQRLKLMKNIGPALVAIGRSTRADRKGKTIDSDMGRLWEEYRAEGGATGFRDMYANSADRADAIKSAMDPTAWMESTAGKMFTANGALKVPMAKLQGGGKVMLDLLSDYNESMENATRLSVYKMAREQGISKQRAASIAKNITVNFNRKGQSAQQIGALYMFFNAAVQGTARLSQTLFTMDGGNIKTARLTSAGKKIIVGGIAWGAMQAVMLSLAGFDDDEPPEFIRERNIIIPIGSKKYVTIPMPLGYHAIPNIGRIAAEFALGGYKKPTDHVLRLLGVITEAFNPIGGGGISVQGFTPTPAAPFVALAVDKDWTGKSISKPTFDKLEPGYTRIKSTASAPAKMIAEAINYLSGGTEYVAGKASPTPDQIDYLFGQVTGGVGRELNKAAQSVTAIATGDDLPPHKIPLVSRFYGDSENAFSASNKFYANTTKLHEHDKEIKGRLEDRQPIQEYIDNNPDVSMIGYGKAVENQIKLLRNQRKQLEAENASRDQIKESNDAITRKMQEFNERMKEVNVK
ncbi:LPD38 domain-containing protein [Herminiimonas sp. CN]|uniref:LPD38 domain-containing protein n=1 Tax=Herminiimonas sp. CN TaxID=1349818 RepID=UPI0004731509|nr:LPD38 domain-containing protein [Herminiimonas sp. CN]